MKTLDKNGVTHIDIGNGRPVQKWVFDFVLDAVEKNLDRVIKLDWFVFRQLLGEHAWTHLQEKKQHIVAGRCFAFMVEHGLFAIERVRQGCKGTHYYRVETK